MTILTLQRRLREIGRIRTGDQVASGNGRSRPNKLDKFRLTSADRTVLDAAASLYGGTVQRWAGAPVGEQYELYTETAEVAVIVPPGDTALSQFYETWSAGGCIRRCDGQTELLSGEACMCAGQEEPTCKPTTRLSVILAELPGLGVWRVESHGYYAATELAGTVDVCRAAAQGGQLLPAVLRLEQRQVKRITNGKAETRNFAVPILDIRVTPQALGVSGHPTAAGALPAGRIADTESWQAIAASPAPEPPAAITAGEMQAAMDSPAKPPAKKRSNSAPDMKPTGLAPGVTPVLTAAQKSIKTVLDQISDPQLRKASKQAFATKHGDLSQLADDLVAEALVWATEEAAAALGELQAQQAES